MAIFAGHFFLPISLESQKIPKPAEGRIPRVTDKSKVAPLKIIDFKRIHGAEGFKQHGQNKREGVVVCAISFGKVGNIEYGMLKDAYGIGHPNKMVQLDVWQYGNLLF